MARAVFAFSASTIPGGKSSPGLSPKPSNVLGIDRYLTSTVDRESITKRDYAGVQKITVNLPPILVAVKVLGEPLPYMCVASRVSRQMSSDQPFRPQSRRFVRPI